MLSCTAASMNPIKNQIPAKYSQIPRPRLHSNAENVISRLTATRIDSTNNNKAFGYVCTEWYGKMFSLSLWRASRTSSGNSAFHCSSDKVINIALYLETVINVFFTGPAGDARGKIFWRIEERKKIIRWTARQRWIHPQYQPSRLCKLLLLLRHTNEATTIACRCVSGTGNNKTRQQLAVSRWRREEKNVFHSGPSHSTFSCIWGREQLHWARSSWASVGIRSEEIVSR